jgi:hypothetical protein
VYLVVILGFETAKGQAETVPEKSMNLKKYVYICNLIRNNSSWHIWGQFPIGIIFCLKFNGFKQENLNS